METNILIALMLSLCGGFWFGILATYSFYSWGLKLLQEKKYLHFDGETLVITKESKE